jgi:hypothetical protein
MKEKHSMVEDGDLEIKGYQEKFAPYAESRRN